MLTDIQIALSDHSLDQSLKDIAQKVLSGQRILDDGRGSFPLNELLNHL